MAVLVTGGTGFVGANIVKELAQRGYEVVSLDVVPADDLTHRFLAPWAAKVTWLEGDILDRQALDQASHSVTEIVHAATYTPYGDIEKDDAGRVVDINLAGTGNMLELAHQLKARRFVYISSAGVYQAHPPTTEPMREDTPLSPRGIYSITKYASEGLTQRYADLFGLETTSLRLAQN